MPTGGGFCASHWTTSVGSVGTHASFAGMVPLNRGAGGAHCGLLYGIGGPPGGGQPLCDRKYSVTTSTIPDAPSSNSIRRSGYIMHGSVAFHCGIGGAMSLNVGPPPSCENSRTAPSTSESRSVTVATPKLNTFWPVEVGTVNVWSRPADLGLMVVSTSITSPMPFKRFVHMAVDMVTSSSMKVPGSFFSVDESSPSACSRRTPYTDSSSSDNRRRREWSASAGR
mmetsp:Transcript_25349/g.63830  ORF Transcript_25349/g.63830 Transcript_25349/m.63830 type:complete len:225 (+) Transcript_25349:2294-2968(+)